jgi:hypothetical protein
MTTRTGNQHTIRGAYLFRPESAYYITGTPRRRNEVLVRVGVLIALVIVFVGGLAYFNLGAWRTSLALAATGVEGTAIYTRSSIEVTHAGDATHSSHYFNFTFTVDGRRYEGRHEVDRLTYERGIPAGQELAISYDPADPTTVQARDAPPPPPWLQTGGILFLLVGGVAAALADLRNYNRPYDPVKDGRLAAGVITAVNPVANAVEIHFEYANPLNGRAANGSDRLPVDLASAARVGFTVAVLHRGEQNVRLL